MIILDSCVIRSMKLDSSEADVLRAIVETKTERVGAPWMALEELAAQKALDYLEAHKAAAKALETLEGKSYQTEPKLDGPDAEAVREKWRKEYAGFLEILPTSDSAIREGVYREANILPPAGTKQAGGNKRVKVGTRDVAIWLTAIEYARANPDETVYFVSNDRDFPTSRGGYPPPMDSDVAGLGDRFVHLTNLDELLETVAPQVGVDAADVRGLLGLHTEYVTKRARSIWKSSRAVLPFDIRTQGGEVLSARRWVFPDNVQAELFDVSDIKAYRLGTNSWVVATARWQFAGLAVAPGTVEMGACIWETRILFPARSGDAHAPRIMKANRAVPVEHVSAVDWSKLVNWDLPQRVLETAETEGRKPTLVEMMTSLLMALQPPKQHDELGMNLVSHQHYQQDDESLDEE
ncbi:PIN domain-containing protein [Streptomyces sp. NPDC051956]|uniref:PIN domain-containing protein n=1 Tax=Streptomyces sp. NPDC051956 TaxID=3365677 RepID=UPI0037D6E860